MGGDEFAIISWHVGDPPEALAERIDGEVSRLRAEYPKTRLGATVGHATFATVPADAEDVIRAADDAMYRLKRQRRASRT